MYRLRFRISMSLDGDVAGPHQSVDHPRSASAACRLHEWVVPLKAWREMHGMDGGEARGRATPTRRGADRRRRRHDHGPEDVRRPRRGRGTRARPWNGWWGENPPFHHPVFVLTHHPPAPDADLRRGHVVPLRHGGHPGGPRRGAPRRGSQGRPLCRRRRQHRAPVPRLGADRRDGDQPGPRAPGCRRAALQGRGRHLRELDARAHRRGTERNAPQIYEGAPRGGTGGPMIRVGMRPGLGLRNGGAGRGASLSPYSRRKRRSGGVPASK